MAFKTSTRIDDPISPLINEPWILAQEPFQVSTPDILCSRTKVGRLLPD